MKEGSKYLGSPPTRLGLQLGQSALATRACDLLVPRKLALEANALTFSVYDSHVFPLCYWTALEQPMHILEDIDRRIA